jgi:hypothetical protein
MTIDLKDAYFCVPITASRAFSKLMKPVVALFRRLGIRLLIYLDDIILLNQDQEALIRDMNSTVWLLQKLGFVINWEKSPSDSFRH